MNARLLTIAGVVLAAVAIISFTFFKATDPYRGYDFDRIPQDEPIEMTTLDPGLILEERTVQHPLTGEWITQEQYDYEKKTIEALLCSLGDIEYCEN